MDSISYIFPIWFLNYCLIAIMSWLSEKYNPNSCTTVWSNWCATLTSYWVLREEMETASSTFVPYISSFYLSSRATSPLPPLLSFALARKTNCTRRVWLLGVFFQIRARSTFKYSKIDFISDHISIEFFSCLNLVLDFSKMFRWSS